METPVKKGNLSKGIALVASITIGLIVFTIVDKYILSKM